MKTLQMALFTGIIVLGFGFNAAGAQEITTAQLKEALSPHNQNLPRMVDEVTRLDRIEVAAGEVVYFYTLVTITYDQVNWNAFRELIFQQSSTNYCTAEDMAGFRDANLSMLYIYFDMNGELTGTVKIPGSVCGE